MTSTSGPTDLGEQFLQTRSRLREMHHGYVVVSGWCRDNTGSRGLVGYHQTRIATLGELRRRLGALESIHCFYCGERIWADGSSKSPVTKHFFIVEELV